MAAVPAVRFPMFGLVRLLGVAAAAVILVWAVHFRGGMAFSAEKDKLLIFNVIQKKYLLFPFYSVAYLVSDHGSPVDLAAA
ncbi:putative transmembrane ascorbate ferrireductase 2 [Hordeum vulgare]|nr:putative transmembrane ascorbate ferrireductase 2 [Hordeum vulgare]